MQNASLTIENLGTENNQIRLPLGVLYLGQFANAQDAVLTGEITIAGLSPTVLANVVLSSPSNSKKVQSLFGVTGQSLNYWPVTSANLFLDSINPVTNKFPFTIEVYRSAWSGIYQADVDVLSNSATVGRLAVSFVVIDLVNPVVEELDPTASLLGLPAMLQSTRGGFIT